MPALLPLKKELEAKYKCWNIPGVIELDIPDFDEESTHYTCQLKIEIENGTEVKLKEDWQILTDPYDFMKGGHKAIILDNNKSPPAHIIHIQ